MLKKWLIFILMNVAVFYSLRWYYDTRDSRIVMSLSSSIVKVSPLGVDDDGIFGPLGHGSGVFVLEDDLIVTCNHVVYDVPLVEVHVSSGVSTRAYVLGRDEANDIALLRVIKPVKGVRPVKVGKRPAKGTSVLSMGFPGPFEQYVTFGIISAYRDHYVMSDVAVAPGNSGGGVFSRDSRLVGLSKGMFAYAGFSVLVDIDRVAELVDKYARN